MTATRPPLLYPIPLGPAMIASSVGGVIGLSAIDEIYGPIPLIIGGLTIVLMGALSVLIVRLVAGLVAGRTSPSRPVAEVSEISLVAPPGVSMHYMSTDNGQTWTNEDTGEVIDCDEFIRRAAPFVDVEMAQRVIRALDALRGE